MSSIFHEYSERNVGGAQRGEFLCASSPRLNIDICQIKRAKDERSHDVQDRSCVCVVILSSLHSSGAVGSISTGITQEDINICFREGFGRPFPSSDLASNSLINS